MKTKTDITISKVIIGWSVLFILPFLIWIEAISTTFGLIWISFWTFLILFGLWKVESFILSDKQLTKTNFFGLVLVKRTVDLQTLVQYHLETVDADYPRNPMNFVRLFSKDCKYLRFRKIILEFETQRKMVLDERTVDNTDFQILYAKLKGKYGKFKK